MHQNILGIDRNLKSLLLMRTQNKLVNKIRNQSVTNQNLNVFACLKKVKVTISGIFLFVVPQGWSCHKRRACFLLLIRGHLRNYED